MKTPQQKKLSYIVLLFITISTSFISFKRQSNFNRLCNVVLEAGTCVGDILTVRSSDPVRSITWMLDGVPILDQNIALQNNGVLVAGGNGNGNAQNQFNNPAAIFVDKNGNLFIPDMTNNRVQKWASGASSGITVAGGNGSGNGANQFNRPTGVSVDKDGNIYVADQNNGRVQKWAPGATSGTTVIANIGAPTRLCFDKNGNLFVSAQSDDRILMLPNANGPAMVVAGGNGNGRNANQLARPTGIFVDDKNNLYVCDTDNTRIQKWVIGANFGTTVASLNTNPLGIYVDKTDQMYICDYTGYAVIKWALGAPSGSIIAGGNGPGNSPNQIKPVGIFMDDYNNLFVSDFDNARVIKFTNIYTGSYTALKPGTYTAKITTTNGCEAISNPINIKAKTNSQIIVATNNSIVCSNYQPTFTATITDGGSNPSLQWKINGTDVPNANSNTFSNGNLKSGDIVSCILTNLDPCTTNPTVTSNNITLQSPSETPNVIIKENQNNVCEGTLLTFEAQNVNAGNSPTYQWIVNGAPTSQASNSNIFSSNLLKDGDIVSCNMLSDAKYCQTNSLASSNSITVKLKPILTPELSIYTNETNIYEGLSITFKTNAINQGILPTYTWLINGKIAYTGSSSFTTNKLKNGDQVSCYMKVTELCVSNNIANSNTLTINVIKIYKIIPTNTFSPNGDGVNDFWNIDELKAFPTCKVTIFSSNGSKVFNSIGYEKPWDGNFRNKACMPGVYYYLIDINDKQKISGTLTIIK